MQNRKLLALISATLLGLSSLSALASPIFYEATDLSDDVAGQDLWQYEYHVANTTGLSLEFFEINFDAALYDFRLINTPFGDEVDPSDYSSPIGWESLALPSDPFFGADGALLINLDFFAAIDAISPVNAVSSFFITFIWNGVGTPGSQSFSYFEAGSFSPSGSSFTQSLPVVNPPPNPVSAPTSLAIALMGLGFVALRRQRQNL